MKAHLIDKFINDEQTAKDIESLMNLDDTKFAALSSQIMENLDSIIKSQAFTNEMLTSLKDHPIEDINKELEAINSIKQEINEDDSLSQEKKDFLIKLFKDTAEKTIQLSSTMREMIPITIEKISPNAKIPTYAHNTDSGADVYASEDVHILPNTTVLVKTGIKVAIPKGYEIQVRPRSGISLKTNLRIANAPGTIDAGYRNEICIIMSNIGNEVENIHVGDRIAQLVIAPTPMMFFTEGKVDEDTDRGTGGFGSTGQ